MSNATISVERLSKRYRIRRDAHNGQYVALRDVLAAKLASPVRWLTSGRTRAPREDFWALRDVSFSVQRGEVLGVIGRNGAGKSTLLKILSRITEPTEGRVVLDGRVASLLEVGTGFHPELTGRQNIFLNGSILGMSRSEVARKFDAIVAFAEVDRFLDTPVKRYSSGMYVRLAFAVAAHMEPEILLVDEVLAVGDVQFQNKCLGRMKEVVAGGHTVVFVSHNMNAVESLCTRAISLDRGDLTANSHDVRAVITEHLSAVPGEELASVWRNTDNSFDHEVMQPLYFAIEDANGTPLRTPTRNDAPLTVVIRAALRRVDPSIKIGFTLLNETCELLSSLTTDGPEESWPPLTVGEVEFRCPIPTRFLNEGAHRIELHCSLHNREWIAQPGRDSPAVHFKIQGGLSNSPYWVEARPGVVAPEWKWQRSR
jgi:lipopolysaccharide transport system ATP-binding protein